MTYSPPVRYEARSDTRKATSSATSSGRPGRPRGIPPRESISPVERCPGPFPHGSLTERSACLPQWFQSCRALRSSPVSRTERLRLPDLYCRWSEQLSRQRRPPCSEGHGSLDRRDMDDHARPPLYHRGEKPPIQAYSGEQVLVEIALPVLVAESQHSSRWRGGTADDVDQDVYTPETIHGLLDNLCCSLGGAHIGLEKPVWHLRIRWDRSCRRHHDGASVFQAFNHGFPHALRAPCDQDPFLVEFIHVLNSPWMMCR